MVNSLAYFGAATITDVKSFIISTSSSWWNFVVNCFKAQAPGIIRPLKIIFPWQFYLKWKKWGGEGEGERAVEIGLELGLTRGLELEPGLEQRSHRTMTRKRTRTRIARDRTRTRVTTTIARDRTRTRINTTIARDLPRTRISARTTTRPTNRTRHKWKNSRDCRSKSHFESSQ
jgi:hypothetical protein